MPYDANDPRSKLSTAVGAPSGAARPATYRAFDELPADEDHIHGSRTWWTRTQSMVIAHTEAQTGDVLTATTAGEYAVLLTEGVAAIVEHSDERASVGEYACVFMPSGSSKVTITTPGTIVRVFGAPTVPHLADQCANASDYAVPDSNVAVWAPWPDSPEGEKIRVYLASDYPNTEGRLGRLFRCSTVMINLFDAPATGRDPDIVSPHHHADFEQVSVQLKGDFLHNMRVTWASKKSEWRPDEHQACNGPATVVIPPPLIHTTQVVGDMPHFLIDVFGPPRFDFSEQPGWVLNADTYPMPSDA